MTCVAGVEHRGRVYIGGDSCVSWSSDDVTSTTLTPKVVAHGPLLIGWAGDLGPCCLVAHSWKPPEPSGEPLRYVAGSLVPSLREALRDANMRDAAVYLLIGYAGRLVYADSDGAVHAFGEGYGAIGCGASVALGALYALDCIEPGQRISAALEAAGRHCPGVGPPYHVLNV